MAYLLTQMLLGFLCAAVLGAALGWLGCRLRVRQTAQSLRGDLQQREQQLRQAGADLTTLQDEYNELARQSREEIEELTIATEAIPLLERNLEKSQQMVRQLMQKHAAQVHELSEERDTLKQRLSQAANAATERDRLQALLDREREQRMELTRQIGALDAHSAVKSQAELDLEPNEEPEEEPGEAHGLPTLEDRVDLQDPAGTPACSPPLFAPVSQHDDLQKIMGIGPVTEKTLNQLGITSYSQLAELEQHDIQKIASALDMGAETIEGLDWVGLARQQLESVLEEL